MPHDPVGSQFERAWQKKRADEEAGALESLIPARNGMALAAYYYGVFALPFCVVGLGFIGFVPILLGLRGLSAAKYDSRAGGRVHAWIGIILGFVEVLTCVAIGGYFIHVFSSLGQRAQ